MDALSYLLGLLTAVPVGLLLTRRLRRSRDLWRQTARWRADLLRKRDDGIQRATAQAREVNEQIERLRLRALGALVPQQPACKPPADEPVPVKDWRDDAFDTRKGNA